MDKNDIPVEKALSERLEEELRGLNVVAKGWKRLMERRSKA